MKTKERLWEIYNKIEEYAKTFCRKNFYTYDTKLDDCTSYISDKVLDNDMHKIKQFKEQSSVSTYAYVVAKNLFYDFNKKLSTKIKKSELNEEITVGNSEVDSLLEFESLLKHLNFNQQLILKLKRDELGSKQIAPIVDMTSKEVDREYEKIKKILRKLES